MGRTVFISGSFTRDYEGMKRKTAEFEDLGFTVLSPKSPIVTSPNISYIALRWGEDPIIRKTERKRQKALSKKETKGAIEGSDLFYMYNPGGFIDPRNSLELGIAVCSGKLTFAEKAIDDITLCEYCPPATMSQIIEIVSGGSSKIEAWLDVWSPRRSRSEIDEEVPILIK
jgi:hypothetical protein